MFHLGSVYVLKFKCLLLGVVVGGAGSGDLSSFLVLIGGVTVSVSRSSV